MAKHTADDFIKVWKETGGNLEAIREKMGYATIQVVANRRRAIEKLKGITLKSASDRSSRNFELKKVREGRRIELEIVDGTILIGSDAHVWPGELTTAQRGFQHMAARLKPTAIVMNGDVFDGAKISRHPPYLWSMEKRPKVKDELEACQNFLVPLKAKHLIWNYGNHDARFEYTLAAAVPEYSGVAGTALKDHFPEWQFSMAVFVNENTVIKHRHANGIHATYNNALRAGRHMVTGHLHSPKVTPWTDYNGTRYGVDCGTLADPQSDQFDYMEEGPQNHRSGFVLLTYRDGKLLMPEIIQVWDDDHVEFRGEIIKV